MFLSRLSPPWPDVNLHAAPTMRATERSEPVDGIRPSTWHIYFQPWHVYVFFIHGRFPPLLVLFYLLLPLLSISA